MAGISISDLRMSVGRGEQAKQILRGISLEIPPGQITGVAGESGSGKTMTGLSILGLQPSNTAISGTIDYDGRNLVDLPPRALNALRGNEIAMVFQDPSAALHPMMSIETQLTDHLRLHEKVSRKPARSRALEVLKQVQVPSPEAALKKYPHQFSGGQLQRIAIAGAIICQPAVLIADEPTTALDVTVQAGILRLIRELCDDLDLAVLLVTHDFGVMSSIADTVVVMREGEIVESGGRHQVITDPQHEYTKALIDSLPTAHLSRSGAHSEDSGGLTAEASSEGGTR